MSQNSWSNDGGRTREAAWASGQLCRIELRGSGAVVGIVNVLYVIMRDLKYLSFWYSTLRFAHTSYK